ncbi:MAG: metallophosphoesterase [Candidatus Thiodiazotropha endolucinida]
MTGKQPAHVYYQPTKMIGSMLDRGKSVLLSAPVGARITEMLNVVASNIVDGQDSMAIGIDLAYLSDNSLDMQGLWEQLSKPLKSRKKMVVETPTDLGIMLSKYLSRRADGARLLLMISGARNESLEHVYNFIVEIHSQQEKLRAKNKYLQFIIIDHHGLRFYIDRNLPLEESDLNSLENIETPVFDQAEIIEGLSAIREETQANFDIEIIGKNIFEATGGHYSLVMLIIEHLLSMEFQVDSVFWNNDVARIFESSDVVRRLRQALVEDREGLIETAVRYTEGLPDNDFKSPRTKKLRTLGVLYVTSEYCLKLCGGFIRKLLEALRDQKSLEENSLGTFQTISGLASYDGREFNVKDSDLVFLHVSDLHIGNEHAFKIRHIGRRSPGERGTLGEYIRHDLEKMGLSSRVDGLLISGDITCRADPGEFARAEEIIGEIADVAGVPRNKIALVPGNHDIQWQPDEYSSRNGVNGTVSRENFDRFYRNIVGHTPEFPEIRRFLARDDSEIVDLVCLDSNFVEGPEAAGIGMIDANSLRDIGSKLADLTLDGHIDRSVWFLSHHHYLPVCDSDVANATKRKVSIMANASQVLNIARDNGAEMVLHGHQHQPFLCYASRWMGSMEPIGFRPILIVGAGSAAVKREHLGPIAQNHYFVLVRQRDRVIVRSRRFGEEGLSFTPHEDFILSRPLPERRSSGQSEN